MDILDWNYMNRMMDELEEAWEGIVQTKESRIMELEKALHYYGDHHKNPSDGPWGTNSDDWGRVAREALEVK